MDPRYQWDEKGLQTPRSIEHPKKYQVLVYDTFAEAKSDVERLRSTAAGCDQLNIVVRQEGNMDDPELMAFGKVFAGAAWALIHDRRIADGWYNAPH
jgi:hypothetical protein